MALNESNNSQKLLPNTALSLRLEAAIAYLAQSHRGQGNKRSCDNPTKHPCQNQRERCLEQVKIKQSSQNQECRILDS